MVNENLTSKTNQTMDDGQVELYKRIQAFSLDRPDAQLSFSKRLARDNGWSLDYAQQVIKEYKKFAFLAVTAEHPVTPSDQVDQAWHLHLTYTRSYWEEFCEQILQVPLHHAPTLGGQAENQKFDNWYSKTLESYEQFFGQIPPIEIWSTPKARFGRDLHFVRVNNQQNWVLSKLQVQRGVIASIAILFTLTLSGYYVSSSESNINPFAGTLLAIISVAAGFGALRILVGIVNFLKNPSYPKITGGWDGIGYGDGGCGVSDWGNSGSHGFSGDSSSSDGGGCGGGGCGGGGCGG
ncbi:glycine-rich domain-containing protein [Synechocystis sp. PCC 7509]|uniref:glycine-rich domain-containing protein n=1 Tax=Synechocystis sp. PCC 7509 TaxID=927677 RepID=UPI0002ABFBC8|nr:hypothetical protein [Synechocystis sp. PCC 7509]